MDLGPGRTLQDADLGYFLSSGAEVICHTNSNGIDVPDWDDFHFGNAGITSRESANFNKVGVFKKWAAVGTLSDRTFLVIDLKSTRLPSVIRRIERCSKDQRVVVVYADWSVLSDEQFSELRSRYAFYGHERDGVFITDASVVTNIVRLGVTHSGGSVVAVDI